MSNEEPIAYFLTWPTYGTWLPGDERGWVEYHRGWQIPDAEWEQRCRERMTEDACVLTEVERGIVERQVAETCRHKGWELHAVACRSNHVHVVVSAPVDPKIVRDQIKAWATRRLREHRATTLRSEKAVREKWWVERGSVRWIWETERLVAVTEYVVEQQDNPRRFAS